MTSPKQIRIKETVAALRKLQKANIPMISNRIRAIIEIKKHEKMGISKREVAGIIGVNHNSVRTWRKMYEQGGIEAVLHYRKQPRRPSAITSDTI